MRGSLFPGGVLNFTAGASIPRGFGALRVLSIMTALREANQVGNLQPTTIVSYDAEVEIIFDCRDELALEEMGMDAAMLAHDGWREQMRLKGEATTQIFARRLIAAGYSGLLVRSFAKGANKDDLNLVLWRWGHRPSRLTLIDDENRLSR